MKYTLTLLLIFFMGIAESVFAIPTNCDFYGTATYRGAAVSSGDVVAAYDADGHNMFTAYYVSGGNYAVHVAGQDADQPGDEGANEGEAVTFRINGEVAVVTGGSNIWTFGGSVECNIEVPDDHHDITINSSPSGLSFTAGGSSYTTPHTFSWKEGDSYNISISSPQNGTAGTRYVFASWSNGQNQSFTYSVPYNDDSFTANFTTQYQLTVNSTYGNPTGAGWYNAGSSATFGVTTPIESNGSRSTLASWTGTGSGSYSGSVSSNTVTMNNPITETASWNSEHYLDLNSAYGNLTGEGWYVEGTIANFSISPTTVNESSTRRHFFNSWSGSGSGSYSGSNSSGSVTMNNPVTETVVWDSEYYLTLSENPDVGGDLNPPPPGDWYAAGTSVQLTATPNTASDYSFSGWTGDLSGTDNPKSITMNGPKQVTANFGNEVKITIQTNPPGLEFMADNVTYTGAHTFSWNINSQHNLYASILQDSDMEGKRYNWNAWSNGGNRSHVYIVADNAVITVFYFTEYELSIETAHGTTTGQGWYMDGEDARFSISETPVEGSEGVRYFFNGWQGSGTGSYTGSNVTNTVTMNNPITEIIDWTTQYYLTMNEVPDAGGNVFPLPPGAWYDAGTVVDISANVASSYIWTGWSGDKSGVENPSTIQMNAPKTVNATFSSDMMVTIQTNPLSLAFLVDGNAYVGIKRFSWEVGEQHDISVIETQTEGNDTRHIFNAWSDGGVASHTYEVQSITDVVTANFDTEYYLDIQANEDVGSPFGEDWYAKGVSAEFGILDTDTIVPISSEERYKFSGWTSESSDGYTGQSPSTTVTMNGPVVENLTWNHEFYVTLAKDPEWGGTLSPIDIPGGWASGALSLYATGNIDSSYGFVSWSGDVNSSANPIEISMDGPKSLTAYFSKGEAIIKSVPSGLTLNVDGQDVITPYVPGWAPNTTHTISAPLVQGDSLSSLYQFLEWSDGKAATHYVISSTSNNSFIATYDAYHYVDIEADSGMATGEGLYREGTTVSIHIDSLTSEQNNIRYRFDGWTGTGDGSVSESRSDITVVVNEPIVETAYWQLQFKITIETDPEYAPGAIIHKIPDDFWHDPGQALILQVELIDPTYTFLGWSGDLSGTNNPETININSAKTITGLFHLSNMPPTISALPDTAIFEDHSLVLGLDWLKRFVSDDQDPVDSMLYRLEDRGHFNVVLDTANQNIIVKPIDNWSGIEPVKVFATDKYNMSDSATFNLTVYPFPDEPAPFDLISPSQDSIFWAWDEPIPFRWEESVNIDSLEGDTITYIFYLCDTEDFEAHNTDKIFTSTSTSIAIRPQSMGDYFWKVEARDKHNYSVWSNSVFRFGSFVPVVKTELKTPEEFSLYQNYPNPFNPETSIEFDLPNSEDVELAVFDIRGCLVSMLIRETMQAGSYLVNWDGLNDQGRQVASGVYIYRIKAGSNIQHRKMLLLR